MLWLWLFVFLGPVDFNQPWEDWVVNFGAKASFRSSGIESNRYARACAYADGAYGVSNRRKLGGELGGALKCRYKPLVSSQ